MEVDFCGLDEGGAMEKVNDVDEILYGLDFSRVSNDVVGMGFSDLHDGDVVMQKGMSCDCHHYDGNDVKVNGEEILNGNCHHFLSIKNTDVGMGFGDHHHYDGVDVKERENDDFDFLNVGMSVFGHLDGDGTMEKMEHGGEILSGDDGQFQSMENVYLRMCCGHHHDGGYEILSGNDGDGEFLNLEHDGVFFGGGGAIEKVNGGDENPNGNDDIWYAKNDDLGFGEFYDEGDVMENEGVMMNYADHFRGSDHDCNGDEVLVREIGFLVYSFLYPWQSHLLNDYWTELVAFCVPYGHVLTLSKCF